MLTPDVEWFERALRGDNEARAKWMEEHEMWLRQQLSTRSLPSAGELETEERFAREGRQWPITLLSETREAYRKQLEMAGEPQTSQDENAVRFTKAAIERIDQLLRLAV